MKLTAFERKVHDKLYVDKLDPKQIAVQLCCNESRIHQAHRSIKRKMKLS